MTQQGTFFVYSNNRGSNIGAISLNAGTLSSSQGNMIFTNSDGQLCFGMDNQSGNVVLLLDDEDGQPIFTFSEEDGTAILDGGDTDVTVHKPLILSDDVSFASTNYGANGLNWDKSANLLNFVDGVRASFGTGFDLSLYHQSDTSFINVAAGDLHIENSANDKDIILKSDDGSGGITQYINCDGSEGEVQLYHADSGSSSVKLTTKSTGVNVTGTLTVDSSPVPTTSKAIALAMLFG